MVDKAIIVRGTYRWVSSLERKWGREYDNAWEMESFWEVVVAENVSYPFGCPFPTKEKAVAFWWTKFCNSWELVISCCPSKDNLPEVERILREWFHEPGTVGNLSGKCVTASHLQV